MPRIRRWHPVSHDFVRDPEVQELRRRFGHWMSDVWLEMLSISDRNSGYVNGDRTAIARSLSTLSLCTSYEGSTASRRNVDAALDYMTEKGWITSTDRGFFVCNYATYHPTRDAKPAPRGGKSTPLLPSLPSLPSVPSTPSPVGEEAVAVPQADRNGFDDWPEDFQPIKTRIQTVPFLTKHQKWLSDLGWWKAQDERFENIPAYLDALLAGAAAYIVSVGYTPRSKRGLLQKLHNCMEIEARKVERETRKAT